jgi:exosortase A-associated hydrolase 2
MVLGHFIPSQNQTLFVAQFGQANPQKTILLLPSIFEEMNLCRAIVAKQAQFLAKQEYCVYALDYAGCGDSQGEINQVNADQWSRNVLDTVDWLKQGGAQSVTLWGVRFGGLLALSAADAVNVLLPLKQILLWKPVTKGKQFMTQFLRLKQANSMMQGQSKVNWREVILAGEETEVAGYPINADLLSSLDKLEMPKQLSLTVPIVWFELAAKRVSPAVQMQTKLWPQQSLHIQFFEGSAFWQIPEIFAQTALHQPTFDALEGQV